MRPRFSLHALTMALLAGLLLGACGTAGNGEPPGSGAARRSPMEALSLASSKTSEAKTGVRRSRPAAPGRSRRRARPAARGR
jgi:hypothetical protein